MRVLKEKATTLNLEKREVMVQGLSSPGLIMCPRKEVIVVVGKLSETQRLVNDEYLFYVSVPITMFCVMCYVSIYVSLCEVLFIMLMSE